MLNIAFQNSVKLKGKYWHAFLKGKMEDNQVLQNSALGPCSSRDPVGRVWGPGAVATHCQLPGAMVRAEVGAAKTGFSPK